MLGNSTFAIANISFCVKPESVIMTLSCLYLTGAIHSEVCFFAELELQIENSVFMVTLLTRARFDSMYWPALARMPLNSYMP